MAPDRLGTEDRQELVDLVARYAQACDRRDVAAVVACFTADATFEYDGGARTVRGHEALKGFYQSALTDRTTASDACTHLMGNVLLTASVDGPGAALGETSAVAWHVYRAQGRTVMRGLHYSDRFLRTDSGWLIAHRRHRAAWQSDLAGAVSKAPENTAATGVAAG